MNQPTPPTPSPGVGTGEVTGITSAVQPDGSVNIKITNFMDAFGSAMSLATNQRLRPS
jgi:hypothetical protein